MHMKEMYLSPTVRGDLARANFMAGYGCAQAVLLAFADVTGLEDDTAARLASSFGGGMGRLREVCGAVSGALMVLGLSEGYCEPLDIDGKSRHYALVRDFAERFKARVAKDGKAGSIVCRDILAAAKVDPADVGKVEARTEAYYQKRPCPELCAIAAEILAEMLAELHTAK